MKYFYLFFALLTIVSCNNPTHDNTESGDVEIPDSVRALKFDAHKKYTASETDTLLTNLATYIYRKPADAQWNTKFESRFRPFYIENRVNFEIIYMIQNTDSSYYYYLLRDAQGKNMQTKRGVIGRMTLDANLAISNFEEIVNTPAASDDNLKKIGLLLMEEIIATGNLKKYLNDKTKVEYPDGQVFYSKEKFEWRSVE